MKPSPAADHTPAPTAATRAGRRAHGPRHALDGGRTPRPGAPARERRTGHVFRTIGRGLVAEYGPG